MKYPESIGRGAMTSFEAAMILNGFWELTRYEPSEENIIEACQLLIDNGMAWTLQGRVGSTCQIMIDSGLCTQANGD
jgi:hypothetical protein